MDSGTKPKPGAFEVWGLTGGIASGKTAVARILAQAGMSVIDADQISRELSAEGGLARGAIEKRFGTADRAKLRKIVFDDPQARKDLEAILHPLIKQESRRKMAEQAQVSDARFIYEASLLIEAGKLEEFAGLIVVEAPVALRIARLHARDGIDEVMARKILAAQLSDEERRKHADYVIVNDSGPEELKARVLQLAHAQHWI